MGAAELPSGVPAHWGDALDPAPRRVFPLLAWCGSLLLALALLLAVDGGEATPGLTDLAGWHEWLGARPVEQGAFVVARLLALAVAWYLVGVTAVAVVARVADQARLVRVADLLAVGPVRTLAQQALGTGLAIGVLGTAVPTLPSVPVVQDGAGPVEDAVIAGEPTVPAASARDAARPSDEAITVRTDRVVVGLPVPGPGELPATDAATTPATSVDAVPATAPAPATASAPAPVAPTSELPPGASADASDATAAMPVATGSPAGPAVHEHTVVAGDHLWALAATAVADAEGATPSAAAIHAHWQRVVEVNRSRLVDPDNPDLLLPGQVVVLPAVTS